MSYKLLNIFLIIIFPTLLFGAPPKDALSSSSSYYYGKLGNYSAFAIPSNTMDSLNFYLFYKLPLNNYLYVLGSKGEYVANYTIELTLSDEDGIVRFHKIISDTASASSPLTNNYNYTFKIDYLNIKIPNKDYNLNIRAVDNNSRNQEKTSLKFIYSKQSKKNILSYLFLSNKDNSETFTPIILNNALNFSGDKIRILFSIDNKFSTDLNKIQIKRIKNENEDFWTDDVDIKGNLGKIQTGNISVEQTTSNNCSIKFDNFQDTKVTAGYDETNYDNLYYFDIQNNNFIPGNYLMNIINSKKDTIAIEFKVIWDDEPLSLKNIQFAKKISEIFFNKDEMDKINTSDKIESFQNLVKEWDKFNPNPKSKYNEVMVEFYRRVDIAYFKFSTFSEKNGALTDQGKVFILYGNPDKIKQVFRSGKLVEVWTYEKLIKEFTFESIQEGVFKLTELKE
ncbi:MAG: GWxTD domain-containing protein [Candidatus Kapaibacteriota bacterium]